MKKISRRMSCPRSRIKQKRSSIRAPAASFSQSSLFRNLVERDRMRSASKRALRGERNERGRVQSYIHNIWAMKRVSFQNRPAVLPQKGLETALISTAGQRASLWRWRVRHKAFLPRSLGTHSIFPLQLLFFFFSFVVFGLAPQSTDPVFRKRSILTLYPVSGGGTAARKKKKKEKKRNREITDVRQRDDKVRRKKKKASTKLQEREREREREKERRRKSREKVSGQMYARDDPRFQRRSRC